MAYLNLDPNYFDHPKTKRLIACLGKGAEVLPLRLWAYVARLHPENGKLAGYSIQETESIAGWWGKSGDAIRALLRLCWIRELPEGGYEIHDWLDYQGHIVAFKRRAKTAAIKRWGADTPSNATSMLEAFDKQCPNLLDQPTNDTRASPPSSWGEEDPEVNRFLVESGFAANCSPRQMQDYRELVAIAGGALPALSALKDLGKRKPPITGKAAVIYATKQLAGERAAKDSNGRKPLTKPVKYE